MEVALSIINTHMRNGTVPQASPETFRFLKQMAEPARLRYIRSNPERILRNTLKGQLHVSSTGPVPAHAPLFVRIYKRNLHVSTADADFYRQYKLSPFTLKNTEGPGWIPLAPTTTTNFTENRIGNELSKALPVSAIREMLLNQSNVIPRLSKRNIERLVRNVRPISSNTRNNKVVFAMGTPSSRRKEFLEFARNLLDHLGTAELTPNALANKSKWLLGSHILDQRTEYALENARRKRTARTAPRARATSAPGARATSAPGARPTALPARAAPRAQAARAVARGADRASSAPATLPARGAPARSVPATLPARGAARASAPRPP